jgi:pyruvate dehydrogenase kinase 2/3/4
MIKLLSIKNNSLFYLRRNLSAIHSLGDEKDLLHFGNKKQTKVSLQALLLTGTGAKLSEFDAMMKIDTSKISEKHKNDKTCIRVRIQVACFLHRELPIRLAHRALELDSYPLFSNSPSIKTICNLYKQSFKEIRECEIPRSIEKENAFANVIESIYERHSNTLILMAKGAHQIKTLSNLDEFGFAEMNEIQKRLDDFYMSRIGIRMLIGQYLALRENNYSDHMIGLVSKCASPYDIAKQVIEDASYMCCRVHGDAPNVEILGRTDLNFPYGNIKLRN